MDIQVSGGAALQADMAKMPDRTTKAMVRALNRGINSAKTVMVLRISKDAGLKSKDVRAALPVTPATANRPIARLATNLKRIPLIKFGARGPEPSRGKGRGVTYRIGNSGRQRIPNAFIGTMASGHRGVFVRKAKGRLPIREAFGPSLGHVFAKYRKEAGGIAQEFFDRNFARELAWYSRNQADRAGTD
jgi:hypothetical protein